MLGSIYRFIVGNFHKHEWEVISNGIPFIDAWERRPMRSMALRCKHCGNVMERKIGA